MTDSAHDRYRSDAEALSDIGRSLEGQSTRITVQLPAALAEIAVAAWDRVEEDELSI